jgi:hypothetical protein
MSWTPLTEDEYVRTVASLRGRCVMEVSYFPLAWGGGGGDGDIEVEDWDFGDWHLPTMGVELLVDDGTRYAAVWGHSFDYHGLEIYRGPMSGELGVVGQPGGAPKVPVTEHVAWSGILGAPLTGAEILWSKGAYGRRLPVAVELSTQTSAVWLVAAVPATWPADGHFNLGTDDVMVVFTHALAEAIGLAPRAERGPA